MILKSLMEHSACQSLVLMTTKELYNLSLSQGPSKTSTRTREKLRETERLLAARGETTKTSTRTREKLEAANAKLSEYQNGYSTTKRTREKLIETELQLAATSTRTKERLKALNKNLPD
jgi:hypothetical protein